METTIDARGLACPQPVLLTMKALKEYDKVYVFVDNDTAVENLRRLAEKSSCDFAVEKKGDEHWEVVVSRREAVGSTKVTEGMTTSCELVDVAFLPSVIVFSDNRMGRGDDTLGEVLLRSFIHTLLELKPLPQKIICYNAGVKLTAQGSSVLQDLQELAQKGVEILVCGTCVNYYGLGDQIMVGRISNMYEIAETMTSAGKLIRP